MATTSIKIVFVNSKTNGFFAKAIKFFTGAKFSHVALQLKTLYFEAIDNGAVFTPATTFLKKNDIKEVIEIKVLPLKYNKICEDAKKLEKTPYDYPSILSIALYKLGRLFKMKPANDILENGRKKVFCSELVYYVLRDNDLCKETKEPELLDPQSLLELLRNGNSL